ncbi:MAG: FkbM family methyltransferase [Mesorhizobium sp.]
MPAYTLAEREDGTRFWINPDDLYVSRGIASGDWECRETAFVRATVKPGMTAVDIGANLGWYTVHLARLVGETGTVVAFEPREDIHYHLCRTVAANNLTNVTVHAYALGAAEGRHRLRWQASDDNPGSTHLSPCGFLDAPEPETFRYQATIVRTLDAVVQSPVDFIKIDVEGAEKLVFDGARRILTQDRPIILSELSPRLLLQISGIGIDAYLSYLRAMNYRVHEIGWDGEISRELSDWPYGAQHDHINVALLPFDAKGGFST